jgi:YVTN family beta-propeller protein
VGNENGASITVIDAVAHKAVATIEIPPTKGAPAAPRPMGAVITPDGKQLFFSLGREKSIAILDAEGRKFVRKIEDVGTRPWGIALSADGRKLYTANGGSGDVSVVDVETGKVEKRITTGGSPWGLVVAMAPR